MKSLENDLKDKMMGCYRLTDVSVHVCRFAIGVALVLAPEIGAGAWVTGSGPGQQIPAGQPGEFRHRSSEAINHGELQEGLRSALEALSAARRTGDRYEEAWAVDQIGNAYFSLSDIAQALENFRAALTMMRQVGDRFGEATALKDVGITLKYFGQYDEAAELLHQAMDIFRQLDESNGVMSALDNLGLLYMSLGAYRLALDFYQRAFEIAEQDRNAEGIYSLLIRMGYLYLELDDPALALEHFRQALEITRKLKRPLDQAWVLLGVSDGLDRLGQVDAAVDACRRSLHIARQHRDGPGVANGLQGLGYFYLDREPAIALGYFQQALAIYEKYNLPLNWSIDIDLARAYRRQGDLGKAIESYQQAIDRLESVRGQLSSEQHRATFLGRHQRVYQELIETLMERHERTPEAADDVRAFATSERAKARALLEAITQARLDVGRELSSELRQQETRLNARLAQLQRRLSRPDVEREERRSLLEQLNQAEQELDRLVTEIRRHNPHYAALQYPEPLSVEQAQALLDGQTAMLAYEISSDRIFAFLLTARAFRAEPLTASPQVVAAQVQNYVELLARDDGAGWQDIGRRLYADLIAPLRRHLAPAIRRLIIVPDGVLHYLPFETLIQEDRGSGSVDGGHESTIRHPGSDQRRRTLLEDFIISYAPSATVLEELIASRAKFASRARTDLLAFANPALANILAAKNVPQAIEPARALYEDEGLQVTPIPFSAAEAEAIARYAGRGSKVYTGSEASEDRVKSEQLDRFRVIHFATHGLISQQAPARSALVLAPGEADIEDGFLQAREIYHLKLASDLVVLSACQTARGQILAGEGVQGVAQAFFYAGAQSVVASLWNVNDGRTATFMEAFYRRLADGQSKAAALRAAKLDLLREPATAGPRYWASFILIGEGNEPVPLSGLLWWRREDRRWPLGLALSLVGLAAGIVLKFRNRRSKARG